MSAMRIVALRVPAGAAKPGPAIGQMLGPLGLNMMDFCKQFNAKTENLVKNTPMQVALSAFADRTFTFEVKSPPTSWFVKRCAGIKKGSQTPGFGDAAGSITRKQLYEIAQLKGKDAAVAHIPLESLARTVAGTALSMGVEIVDDVEAAAAEAVVAAVAAGDDAVAR